MYVMMGRLLIYMGSVRAVSSQDLIYLENHVKEINAARDKYGMTTVFVKSAPLMKDLFSQRKLYVRAIIVIMSQR